VPALLAGVPQPSAVGPVSGLMHMEGRLGGSLAAPEARVQARLVRGAVGGTRLAKVRCAAGARSWGARVSWRGGGVGAPFGAPLEHLLLCCGP